MKTVKFRKMLRERLGTVSLMCILIAGYAHSANFFSGYFDHFWQGALAAFGIDLGLVAMAFYRDNLHSKGESAVTIKAVTVVFVFASCLANLSQGWRVKYGGDLSLSGLWGLDSLGFLMLFFGTVILPVLIYVLVDQYGNSIVDNVFAESDNNGVPGRFDGGNAPASAYTVNPGAAFSESGVRARRSSASAAAERARDLYSKGVSVADIAVIVERSEESVRRYLR